MAKFTRGASHGNTSQVEPANLGIVASGIEETGRVMRLAQGSKDRA
jgi:hypothetical protein